MADTAPGRPAPHDWVTRAADAAIRHHQRSGADGPVTVASGASPSGPVHLGKYREILTPHFVAEELRQRGLTVRHLHSWDDYDRLRRVPSDVTDPSFADHVGRPLSGVPDPWGEFSSYAERWRAPLRPALAEMGIEIEEISQTEKYRSGAYRSQIRIAIDRRAEIERVLAGHRTMDPVEASTASPPWSTACPSWPTGWPWTPRPPTR